MNDGWVKLSLDVDPAHVEKWSEHFLETGAVCIDVGDAFEGSPEEDPIFGEPGEQPEQIQFWHTNRLSVLFEPDVERDWMLWLKEQAQHIEQPIPHCTLAFVDNQDWVTLTQAQFQPIDISPRLKIVPSWHADVPADNGIIELIVDPGMAFGTGTHPTTQLCLQWLDQHLKPGSTVLDYGCGSGILAIAAAKLGAKTPVGVDIDPLALEVAQHNAQTNHVGLHTLLPNALEPAQKFDVVIANILANPLRMLAPILCQHIGPDGILLLSGLWREQAEEIAQYYKQYGHFLHLIDSKEGWALLANHAHSAA